MTSLVDSLRDQSLDDVRNQSYALASGFEAFLETHPQAQDHVVEILDKRLGGQINENTYDGCLQGISDYFGRENAILLLLLIHTSGQEVFEQLRANNAPKTLDVVSRIKGLYYPELADALRRREKLPDDWREVSWEVYFDRLTNRHHLEVKIQKYSGEEPVIKGSPDSILGLTSKLLALLNLVNSFDEFTQESLESFSKEIREFIEQMGATTETDGGETEGTVEIDGNAQ